MRDHKVQVRIAARLRLAEAGNLGDWKSVGGEVSEMRVDVGSGYCPYFTPRRSILIVMLAAGIKSSQARDMKRTRQLVKELEIE